MNKWSEKAKFVIFFGQKGKMAFCVDSLLHNPFNKWASKVEKRKPRRKFWNFSIIPRELEKSVIQIAPAIDVLSMERFEIVPPRRNGKSVLR
jgi:hypothetical protein